MVADPNAGHVRNLVSDTGRLVLTRQCIDAGYYCFPSPTSFSRYAIYAFLALFEVFALFTISLSVEEKIRRSGYDPEWR